MSTGNRNSKSDSSQSDGAYAHDGDWDDEEIPGYSDPLQSFNKAMFKVNDGAYKYGARPLAKFYKAIIPGFLRRGVKHVVHNASAPGRIVNSVLQGKGHRAGRETARFLYNSTAGMAGVWDPARKYSKLSNIPVEDTDQTLAAWGLKKGSYLYLPLLGPTTIRGVFGTIGDAFLYPLTYIDPKEAAYSVYALEKTNDFSFSLGEYEAIMDASLDPYTAIKDAYYQHRVKMEEE